jgi:hypothetical protein
MPSLTCVLISDATADVDSGYAVYFTDTTSNDVTLTFPAITADGAHFYFRNINTSSSFITTILPNGTDTVEFGSSYQLFTGTFNHFVAFGTNWYIIG